MSLIAWPYSLKEIVAARPVRDRDQGLAWSGYEILLDDDSGPASAEIALQLSGLGIAAPLTRLITAYAQECLTVKALISREQQCCESTGHFFEWHARAGRPAKPNHPVSFAGETGPIVAHLRQLVGRYLVSARWGPDRRQPVDDRYFRAATVEFVTVRATPTKCPKERHHGMQTERPRTIVAVLHNTHNGYYPHEVRLVRGTSIDQQQV